MRAFKLAAAAMAACVLLLAKSAAPAPNAPVAYDILVENGTIYDGSGSTPFAGDVGISGDRIAYVGPHTNAKAARVIDAQRQSGLARLHQHAELARTNRCWPTAAG